MKKKSKLIHLDERVVKALSIKAAEAGINVKNYMEAVLTRESGVLVEIAIDGLSNNIPYFIEKAKKK
jgi:hypothetical protein